MNPHNKLKPEIAKAIIESGEQYRKALQPLAKAVQKIIEANGGKFPTKAELEEQDKTAIRNLANLGWFIDLGDMAIAEYLQANRHLQLGEEKKADWIMERFFQNNLGRIEEEVCLQFPHRTATIKAATKALLQGNYTLSIPAILIQTEGMGQEIFEASIYSKQERELSRIKSKFDHQIMGDVVFELFSSLLTNTPHLPIKANSNEVEPWNLNRHAILHGVNPNYGTKTNALKSVSWMNYILQFKTSGAAFFQEDYQKAIAEDKQNLES